MKWEDLRKQLYTREEMERTDVLAEMVTEGILTDEDALSIIMLENNHEVVSKLLTEIARQRQTVKYYEDRDEREYEDYRERDYEYEGDVD